MFVHKKRWNSVFVLLWNGEGGLWCQLISVSYLKVGKGRFCISISELKRGFTDFMLPLIPRKQLSANKTKIFPKKSKQIFLPKKANKILQQISRKHSKFVNHFIHLLRKIETTNTLTYHISPWFNNSHKSYLRIFRYSTIVTISQFSPN
jgi:hypothetical protein